MKFLSRLYQTVSFKLLSFVGYVFGILFLYVTFPAIINPTYENNMTASYGGFYLVIYALFPILILLLSGIIEYIFRLKKTYIEVSATKLILFSVGLMLLFTPIFLPFYFGVIIIALIYAIKYIVKFFKMPNEAKINLLKEIIINSTVILCIILIIAGIFAILMWG